jgi:hypothetical protein
MLYKLVKLNLNYVPEKFMHLENSSSGTYYLGALRKVL